MVKDEVIPIIERMGDMRKEMGKERERGKREGRREGETH